MSSRSPDEPEIIVVDTGPLVSLGRSGALSIIERLPFRFIVPQEVADEIEAGARAGHPVAVPSWVDVVALSSPPSPIAAHALDMGEVAVIQLALERSVPTVCIDEWRARRAARACGLFVTGSLGLLGRAKSARLIDEVHPWNDAAGRHIQPQPDAA